jgi:hypothetical protein
LNTIERHFGLHVGRHLNGFIGIGLLRHFRLDKLAYWLGVFGHDLLQGLSVLMIVSCAATKGQLAILGNPKISCQKIELFRSFFRK